MKTAEELHDYIQTSPIMLESATLRRLFDVCDELNDRCRVLESRLAVAEAKLNAGVPATATPFKP